MGRLASALGPLLCVLAFANRVGTATAHMKAASHMPMQDWLLITSLAMGHTTTITTTTITTRCYAVQKPVAGDATWLHQLEKASLLQTDFSLGSVCVGDINIFLWWLAISVNHSGASLVGNSLATSLTSVG